MASVICFCKFCSLLSISALVVFNVSWVVINVWRLSFFEFNFSNSFWYSLYLGSSGVKVFNFSSISVIFSLTVFKELARVVVVNPKEDKVLSNVLLLSAQACLALLIFVFAFCSSSFILVSLVAILFWALYISSFPSLIFVKASCNSVLANVIFSFASSSIFLISMVASSKISSYRFVSPCL